MTNPFRSLRHRDYRLYFVGQLLSLIGSWTQSTALAWLVYDLTHQAKWPAFVNVATFLPTLILGSWAGAVADRSRKRRLIILTQFGFLSTAATLAILTLAGNQNVFVLLGVMAVTGVVLAFDLPARLAFVPELVPREDLINSVALNSVIFNAARLIGPAVAAVILVWKGPAICFLVNAVSYLFVIAAMLLMRFRDKPRPPRESLDPSGGFAIVRRSPKLRALVVSVALLSVGGWPFLSLAPAYAETVLGEGQGAYSSLVSAVGAGALLAALTNAVFGRESRQLRFLTCGAGLVALSLLGLSFTSTLGPALAQGVVFGFGMILFFSTGQAVAQMSAPEGSRGKVMGVWASVLAAGTPVGNIIWGPLADLFGVPAVFCGMAGVAATSACLLVASRAASRQNPYHEPPPVEEPQLHG